MAGKPKQKPAVSNIPEGIPPGHEITLAEEKIAHITSSYTEERDIINQVLGQAQAFRAVSQFSELFGISKLATVKENKLYKGLAGSAPNGSELSGTWAEFCELLGMSVDKADQDIANLRAFGEEALENLNRLGVGYRDMRKLRKLPDDVREQIVQGQLVNLTDKDEVVALIDDLASKHAAEKSALEKQVFELEEDAKALDQIVAKKERALNEKEKLIHKLQNKSGDWHPRAFEICAENTRIAAGMLEGFDKLDQIRDAILNEDFGEGDREAAIEAMAVVHYDALNQIVGRVAEVMAACDEVFIGYKDKPRPMLEVFAVQGDGK